MKILWATTFRPFKHSVNNDIYQIIFINSLKNLNAQIEVCVTQFDDYGVENFLSKSELKYKFINYPKKDLPCKKKYSNKIMLENALIEYCKDSNDYSFFVYSTSDIIVPSNLIVELKKKEKEESLLLIFPNTLVSNGKLLGYYDVVYGIDLIILRLSKQKAKILLEAIKDWNQYDWGINEHFLIAVSSLLKLKTSNLIKKMDLVKFENNFESVQEDRSWQINSWFENQKFLIYFLKKNNLSVFYAKGSYYFLLYKVFNLTDINFRLFIIYLKTFLISLPKSIMKIKNWKFFIS
jgi:hypothetical protein